MRPTAAQLGRLGYQLATVFTLLGLYFCLSRYLLPSAWFQSISLFLYKEDYTRDALPALASVPWTELVHRLFGAAFLVLGWLQFNAAFRKKRLSLHRSLGKVYFLFCLTAAVSGMIFAFVVPFTGMVEQTTVVVFASLLLYWTYRAWTSIRQGDVVAHQAYTRYTYAIGLGIVTIRLLAFAFFTTTALDQRLVFDLVLGGGWLLTLLPVVYYNRLLRPVPMVSASS